MSGAKYICKIDGKECESLKKLHSYVSRTLKMKNEDYYHKYYPRYDYLTGELIEFKDLDFYRASLFNTRENLVTYMRKNPHEVETFSKLIANRAKWKGLTFAPSTVEARTCILPTPWSLMACGYDYNALCAGVPLKARYNYEADLTFDHKPLSVIIDTREQLPLPIDAEITVSKLDFGDYTSTSHYTNVYVERKSLVDLCGTLSGGYDRFQAELVRAQELGSYIVIAVEEGLDIVNKLEESPVGQHSRVTSAFITHRMREICQKFDNVQFLFVKNRDILTKTIEKLFRLENNLRTLDLQFYYDTKALLV